MPKMAPQKNAGFGEGPKTLSMKDLVMTDHSGRDIKAPKIGGKQRTILWSPSREAKSSPLTRVRSMGGG
jgi:hypothetical protein